MTKVIWKYDMPASPSKTKFGEGKFDLHMPLDAEIVCLEKQRGTPQLWVLVNPEQEREQRYFIIAGIGFKVPDNTLYVGSWQMSEGDLVWHLFEYRPGGTT